MKAEQTFTPREVVSELDRYIVGQDEAKKAVAIALRNRWRRQQVKGDLKEEIVPKNIILIGPTGVGKTEIARRLAKLANAPFVKVEATKYTEVGYVGKDVESIIRELAETAVKIVREEAGRKIGVKAQELAEEKILDLLEAKEGGRQRPGSAGIPSLEELEQERSSAEKEKKERRGKLRQQLRAGNLDDRQVEIRPESPRGALPMIEVMASGSIEEMGMNLKEMLGQFMPQGGDGKRKMKVPEALEFLTQQEAQRLIDMEEVTREALRLTEQNGIVFLDELDKVAVGRGESRQGPDVSREGVQRDILPIVEGSTVRTKYGLVRTDHILFIAAGAFHAAKPSDLIPELQGRFPIRVELKPLTKSDFLKILLEPKNSLTKQYKALMAAENVSIDFDEAGLETLCDIAVLVNEQMEDIGARRLHTLMEKVLEEISFSAPEKRNETFLIDKKYVEERLRAIVKDRDLSRYIL